MTARLTFFAIVAFWLTMNALLWRAEFGTRGGDTPVPLQLVWRKILTAPDASSLSVYQEGERMGYCEVSTGVGQQMANFDGDKPPPEGLTTHNGYQIHLAGNVSLGDFTNRLKFDGRVFFDPQRQWVELNLRATSRLTIIEISAQATNRTAHVKFSNEGMVVLERDLALEELQDPGFLLREISGKSLGGFFALLDYPDLLPDSAQAFKWEARRTRVKVRTQDVPIYRLESSLLGRPVTVDVSTLGEILSVSLPGDITAHIDEWNKP